MTEQTPKKPSKWSKPEPEQAASNEAKAHVDPVEEMKQQAEQASETEPKVDGEELPREFTTQDIIKAFNFGQWYGKRLGQLYSLQRTMPHIRKQNERLAKAGHKVGVLKNALRAQVEAGALTAEAFDD